MIMLNWYHHHRSRSAARHLAPGLAFIIAICLFAPPIPAAIATPEATSININQQHGSKLLIGFLVPLDPTTNIGVVVVCSKDTLEIYMSFGAFPSGKLVQVSIGTPSGEARWFGQAVLGSPQTGFHDPFFTDPAETREIIDLAFSTSVLISNGHNSIWNRIPPAENLSAIQQITQCVTP